MRRHDTTKEAVAQVLRSAGILHLLEQGPRLFSQQRQADILLCRWSGGRDTAVDLVVGHPLAKSQHPLTPLKARRFTGGLEAAKVAAAGGSRELQEAGWAFLPMGFNTFAAPGPAAVRLLLEIFQRATADLIGWEKVRAVTEARQCIILALAKQVGEQLMLAFRVQDALSEGTPQY